MSNTLRKLDRRPSRPLLAGPGRPGTSILEECDLSLTDPRLLPVLPASGALTALCLLALAIQHKGRLATFDATFDASLLPGETNAYCLLRL